MAGKEKIKSIIFFLIKTGIAAAAVWFLLLRNPDEIAEGFRHFDFFYIAAAFLVYFLHMLVASWRWWRLARMLNVEISGREAVSLTMQGYFFSLVIPGGAVGGDVVKMGVISRRSRSGEKFEGVFSILMDRIIGMIALFGMALVLIPFSSGTLLNIKVPGFENTEQFDRLLLAGLILLCLAGLAASCVIFFHRIFRRIPLMDKLMCAGDRLSGGMVTRMTGATDVYSKNWKELLVLTVASMAGIHLMTALPVCLLLTGLGVDYPFITVVTALTVGNIIGLIPLFPAGVGGRDIVSVLIMTAGGIASADARTAQLVYTAVLLITSLADGLFFVFDRGRKPEPERK